MSTDVEPEAPPSARPTGTATFLFSDIEGSTQRWDRNRSAMQGAVRLHDALMHGPIAAHDGYVFKTIGDAFCAAFTTPESAARAALEAQRRLAAADFLEVDGLRGRVAINTGTTDEREGDHFGPALNRVAPAWARPRRTSTAFRRHRRLSERESGRHKPRSPTSGTTS